MTRLTSLSPCAPESPNDSLACTTNVNPLNPHPPPHPSTLQPPSPKPSTLNQPSILISQSSTPSLRIIVNPHAHPRALNAQRSTLNPSSPFNPRPLSTSTQPSNLNPHSQSFTPNPQVSSTTNTGVESCISKAKVRVHHVGWEGRGARGERRVVGFWIGVRVRL
jgi:hypothetical protein